MRLLNATTLQLEEFPDEVQAPPYAILSHTWGAEEVSLQQLKSLPKGHSKLKKIESTCRQALKDHLLYIWVDTCCIDKTSSAELSEAINSMFRWYEIATICYAYLADVHLYADSPEFGQSRWFRRGWTLQELLAPSVLRFFNSSWIYIGDRVQLSSMIAAITKIDMSCLDSGLDSNESRIEVIRSATVAKRMSWASERVTTRVEDMAYCLLGLFGVNIPMLYGEGGRAFLRLQEEILKESIDMTIFAWGYGCPPRSLSGWKHAILAESPADFVACGHLQISASRHVTHYNMTNVGLHINLPLITDQENNVSYALLDSAGNEECCIAIQVDPSIHDNIYRKRRTYIPILVSRQLMQNTREKKVNISKNNPAKRQIYHTFPTDFRISHSETIYISRSYQAKHMIHYSSPTGIRISHSEAKDFRVASVHPPAATPYMSENSIDVHLDAEVVVIHFSNDKERQKFKILLQRQKTPNGATECFLSGMEEYSALESVMFGSSMPHIKIQKESVGPTPLNLRCQFSTTCTYTTTIMAWSYSHIAIEIISEDSPRDSNTATVNTCANHTSP